MLFWFFFLRNPSAGFWVFLRNVSWYFIGNFLGNFIWNLISNLIEVASVFEFNSIYMISSINCLGNSFENFFQIILLGFFWKYFHLLLWKLFHQSLCELLRWFAKKLFSNALRCFGRSFVNLYGNFLGLSVGSFC